MSGENRYGPDEKRVEPETNPIDDSHSGDGSRQALQGIDLAIRQGEWLCIAGRNGSGKSTLARIIAGHQPIAAGTIEPGWSDGVTIQMIMQNPESQIVGETVYEDICFGMENAAIEPDQMTERAVRALRLVGMEHLLHAATGRLSGGQKQLLAIAGCLAVHAGLLIFDEATAMLDPASRQSVLSTVRQLQREGTTIVWVTQRMEELAWADRVLALDEGKSVYCGDCVPFFYMADGGDSDPASSFANSAPCSALGLTPPFAVQTAQELLKRGFRLPFLPLTPEELDQALAAGGVYA